MGRKKSVGLREIAKRTGYNVGTVSRALNGRPGISAENAYEIQKTAYEMGYCNSMEKRVAVLLPVSSCPLFLYSMSILNAIRVESVNRRILLEFVFADHAAKMLERSISGILSFEFHNIYLNKLIEVKPMVCLNTFPAIPENVHSVSSNMSKGIAQAVTLLYSYGHRKIGLFLSGDKSRHTDELESSFREQCAFYGIQEKTYQRYQKNQTQYYVYGSVMELLDQGVTAVIANGESESAEVLAGIKLSGRRVPQDVSVICWEVPCFSKFLEPPLTTISQDFTRFASTAFDMLDRIAAKENPPFSTLVDCLLIERSSVSVPPAGS